MYRPVYDLLFVFSVVHVVCVVCRCSRVTQVGLKKIYAVFSQNESCVRLFSQEGRHLTFKFVMIFSFCAAELFTNSHLSCDAAGMLILLTI